MTPKEKAKELYKKAENYIFTSEAHFAEDDCVYNCAIMVVDEINKVDISLFQTQYWKEVRNELKKLNNENQIQR